MSPAETLTDGMDAAQFKRLRNAALIVYVLQAVSLMLGFTLFIGAIISHVSLRAADTTWLASHFRWQILTFWLFFMWAMFGALTMQMGIGYVVVVGAVTWLIYRFVKGWSRLNADEPVLGK